MPTKSKKTGKVTPRIARLTHSMTQKQLSEKLGICSLSYSHKERGLTAFSMTEAMKLCKILGYSLEQIDWQPKPRQ